MAELDRILGRVEYVSYCFDDRDITAIAVDSAVVDHMNPCLPQRCSHGEFMSPLGHSSVASLRGLSTYSWSGVLERLTAAPKSLWAVFYGGIDMVTAASSPS